MRRDYSNIALGYLRAAACWGWGSRFRMRNLTDRFRGAEPSDARRTRNPRPAMGLHERPMSFRQEVLRRAARVLIIGAALSTSANAQGTRADESIRALVGTTIPPSSPTSVGHLSGWHPSKGGIFDGSEISLSEYVRIREKQAILVAARINPDKSSEVVDIVELPFELMGYRVPGKKNVAKHDPKQRFFHINTYCKREKDDEGIVIGLVREEKKYKDCSHPTKQIKAAWLMSLETGKFTSISPKEVTCYIDTGEGCVGVPEGLE